MTHSAYKDYKVDYHTEKKLNLLEINILIQNQMKLFWLGQIQQ